MNTNTRSAIEASGREVRLKNISERVRSIVISPIKEMSILADEFQEEAGVDVVSFGQGIPYLDTPEHIKEAIRKALEKKSTARYTLEPGMTELRELVGEFLQKEKRIVNVRPKREVMIASGCQEAMACALATVIDPGDEVVILSPAFPSHIEQTIQFGGVPVFVELSEENGWRLDLDLLEKSITKRTRAILFSHPSNPTGVVLQERELRVIADLAKARDLIVITDETYDFLTYDGTEHISPASFEDIRDRIILCGSFSKKYSLTGYRVGYAFADSGIIDHMLKVHDALAICAPAISQEAAIAALQGPEDSVCVLVQRMSENRALMMKNLESMRDVFSFSRPSGAYYILARYHSLSKLNSFDFALRMLKEARVISIPGDAFGPGGEGRVRFSFACSPEEIEEGFRRLREWVLNIGQ